VTWPTDTQEIKRYTEERLIQTSSSMSFSRLAVSIYTTRLNSLLTY